MRELNMSSINNLLVLVSLVISTKVWTGDQYQLQMILLLRISQK